MVHIYQSPGRWLLSIVAPRRASSCFFVTLPSHPADLCNHLWALCHMIVTKHRYYSPSCCLLFYPSHTHTRYPTLANLVPLIHSQAQFREISPPGPAPTPAYPRTRTPPAPPASTQSPIRMHTPTQQHENTQTIDHPSRFGFATISLVFSRVILRAGSDRPRLALLDFPFGDPE